MSLFSLLNPAKDCLLAATVKPWLNQTIKRYGHMTQLRIDSTNKRIDIELELKGESSPIQIIVKSYELTSEAGETHIELGEIETSREWINVLVADFLNRRTEDFQCLGQSRCFCEV